jgi:3-hydroxyacyl-[acyl-carrier-protein] dehydratase
MRLIEEVVSVEPGRQAVCRRRTHVDDFYFQGHFPGQPVVPAIVLIELLAQTGGLAAGAAGPDEPRVSRSLRVAAVDGFRFPAGCGAGVTLEATARVVGRMGRLCKIEGTVTAGATLVARGSVTLADMPSPRS